MSFIWRFCFLSYRNIRFVVYLALSFLVLYFLAAIFWRYNFLNFGALVLTHGPRPRGSANIKIWKTENLNILSELFGQFLTKLLMRPLGCPHMGLNSTKYWWVMWVPIAIWLYSLIHHLFELKNIGKYRLKSVLFEQLPHLVDYWEIYNWR